MSECTTCHVVEFAYDAMEADELSLEPGDIILDAQPSGDDGWMTGRKESNDKTGLFPDNFVTKCPKATLRQLHQRLPAGAVVFVTKRGDQQCAVFAGRKYGGRLNLPTTYLEFDGGAGSSPVAVTGGGGGGGVSSEKPQRTSRIVGGIGLGNIFSGQPITLQRSGDPMQQQSPPTVSTKPAKPLPQTPPAAAPASAPEELAIVQYKYEATNADELSLEPGQIVRVLSRHLEDEGWWRGEVNGRVGVFPDNFVAPYQPQRQTPAVRGGIGDRALPQPPGTQAKPQPQHQPPPQLPPKVVGQQPQQPQLHRPVPRAPEPAPNGSDLAKELPPTPAAEAAAATVDGVGAAAVIAAEQEQLRQELQRLQSQDELRRQELQELQKFKRSAQLDIASLKEELDAMSKKYSGVTVDLDRLKRELQTLKKI